MVFSKATLAALAISLFSSANAHMVLSNPVPYGQSSLNNSPLENSGSDFPCKQRAGVYDVTKMNSMPVGVPQKLTFMGGATHGGGSCQVSVTLDAKPTKNSQWKVVHSIIGGCPANVEGNMSDNAQGTGAGQFDFKIPDGMPNGQYTLAWTWFNRVGNREMYMNCAPIEVTGGSDDDLTVFNSLPDMFVANLPREQCETPAGTNLVFPEPGDSVQTVNAASPGTVSGPNCAAQTKLGAGAGNAGTPAKPTGQPSAQPSSQPSVQPSAQPSAPPNPPEFSKRPGEFAPSASSAAPTLAKPTTTSLATVTVTQSRPAGSVTTPVASGTAPAQPTGSASPGTCGEGSFSCSSPGATVCYSLKQWGTCDTNRCAVLRDVPPATNCENGGFVHEYSKKPVRRHVPPHARAHMHHHAFSF